MKTKKAFTLIELLVVISIIALLLSILLPALGLAKQQAMFVICKTRLRDVGLAMRLYAQDNDDKIMGGGGSWTWRLIPYYGYETEYGGSADVPGFLKENKQPWTCPTAIREHKPIPKTKSYGDRTFAVNRDLAWLDDQGVWQHGRLKKITDTVNSAETMMFIGAAQYIWYNEPNKWYGGSTDPQNWYPPGFYHFGTDWQDIVNNGEDFCYVDGRENTLFFDSHVEGVKYENWPSNINRDTPFSFDIFWNGGL